MLIINSRQSAVTGTWCSSRRGALHGGRLDTDGDGSDAVADASVTLATASDLLTTESNVGCAA